MCTINLIDLNTQQIQSAVNMVHYTHTVKTHRHPFKKIRKEMFYLTTHSTHFIDGYIASGSPFKNKLQLSRSTPVCTNHTIIYIYIYIYTEREIKRERGRERDVAPW